MKTTNQPVVATAILFAAATFFALPSAARAHPTDNPIRLGAGLAPLTVTHWPQPDETTVEFGLGPRTLGLHFGYQVTAAIGLGVRTYFGGVHVVGSDSTLFSFSALPRFEYMLTPHDLVGVYFGAELGVQISGDLDAPNQTDYFLAGGLFGLHIFADTHFSVDTEVQPSFIYDVDTDTAGFQGLLYLSFTGWLGTGG